MIKIGTKIDERYRLTSYISTGGMAEVYEADDIISKRRVAIKVMKEELVNDPVNIARFNYELVATATFDHPNIVHVYDKGVINNRPYIAIEYMKGQTLKEKLDFTTRFTSHEACEIMLQLTNAIYYIHCHNVIHRDIKPQNIFYLSDGTVKIGDFGISATKDSIKRESSKSVIGSVHYLAPELSQSHPASEQSDIYALGVTFFELVTGRLPFEEGEAIDIAISHIKHAFPSPKRYNPAISSAIENIILKATKKDPKNRYKTAKEMHDAIEAAMNNEDNFKFEKKGFLARLFHFK